MADVPDPDSEVSEGSYLATILPSEGPLKAAPKRIPTFLKTLQKGTSMHISRLGSGMLKDLAVLEHKRTGVKFTDVDFPPEKTSLIRDWTDYNNVRIYTWNKYVWRRVAEVYPQPIRVFNKVDPNDILQGELGDCYFLSALSAMAEYPHRIEKLFETPDYEPSGCYRICIGEMGELKEIVIDDFVPCDSEGNVAFSRSKQEIDHTSENGAQVAELWVMLLEKAWAKKFGAYFTVDSGYVNEVLSDLTGAPCKVMSTGLPSLWEEIYAADQANYIIAASTSEEAGGADSVGLSGLVGMHAYAVISAAEVESEGRRERILKIRNPWGDTEWNGDWSDSSSKWTPELREKLSVTEENDGTFWMPFTQFEQFFTEVCICKVHDSYTNQYLKLIQNPGEFSVVQVSVSQTTHTYVTVCQTDARLLLDYEDSYDYSDVRIICAKLLPDGVLEFVSSRGRSGQGHILERDVYEGLRLDPGEYLLFLQVDFPDETPTIEVGVAFYSDRAVNFGNVTEVRQHFLTELFTLENAKKHGIKTECKPGCVCYTWSLSGELQDNVFKAGFLAEVYHNETPSTHFEVAAFHRELTNMTLLPPFDGDSYKLELPPGSSEAVLKRQTVVGQPFVQEVRPVVRAKK